MTDNLQRYIDLAGRLLDSEPDMFFGLTNRTHGLPISRAAELVARSLRRSGPTILFADRCRIAQKISGVLNP